MGEQIINMVYDHQVAFIKFDISRKLSDLRTFLIDEKDIDEDQSLTFVKVENGEIIERADRSVEKYIAVSDYMYDGDKVRMVGMDKPLELFAGTLHEYFTFNVDNTLGALRTFLEADIIEKEDETHGWRFVSPTVDWDGDLSEGIVGKDGSEKLIKVKDFLYGKNKVRMANINRKNNPDLIGVGTNQLTASDVTVQVTLNRKYSPGKFQPIMMKDVRTADKHSNVSNFVNVVLCEKKTAIGFTISVKNHNGFAFSIKPREGDPIVDYLYCRGTKTGMSFYKTSKRAIEIDSYKDLRIPTAEQIGHRRITVQCWRFISYQDKDRNTHYVDPKYSSGDSEDKDVELIPGEGIEGGAAHEGEQTDGKIGTVYNVVEDTDDILGTVEIDFFVFKTREDAQRMIESRVKPD